MCIFILVSRLKLPIFCFDTSLSRGCTYSVRAYFNIDPALLIIPNLMGANIRLGT
jgi:hypothetical protein